MGNNKTKAGLIVILGGALAAQGCPNGIQKTKIESNRIAIKTERDSIALEKRLQYLAETPYEGKLATGAMCYVMAIDSDTIDYICPYCNDTIRNMYSKWNIFLIDDIQLIVDDIKSMGFDAVLDKSNFCPNCTTQGFNDDYRELIFKIRFSENAEYHTMTTNFYDDYYCVRAFLSGRSKFKNDYDYEYALHDHIDVIQRMTGLGRELIINEE